MFMQKKKENCLQSTQIIWSYTETGFHAEIRKKLSSEYCHYLIYTEIFSCKNYKNCLLSTSIILSYRETGFQEKNRKKMSSEYSRYLELPGDRFCHKTAHLLLKKKKHESFISEGCHYFQKQTTINLP